MAQAVWHPSLSYKKKTRLYQWMQRLGYETYDSFYQDSITDMEWFWEAVAQEMDLHWFKEYESVIDLSRGMQWPEWFVQGRLNVTHNAVHKWLEDDQVRHRQAIIWEGEEGQVQTYTYAELAAAVHQVAAGLKEQGLQKGDRVTLYMPMIPETVISMLAIAQIGAIFTPTFSGYGADAVAKRLQASEAKMFITADGYYRRGKEVPMKEMADEALRMSPHVKKQIVVQRIGRDIPWNEGIDLRWADLLTTVGSGREADVAHMESNDPFMLIYTSGTTGRPKGVVHTHSGFPVKAAFDAGYGMDLKQEDTLFWVTDMGWMMGPFLVYGALLNGATMVLYDGTPTHPQPDRLWELVEKHQVTHLGISPTLIRSLMTFGTQIIDQHDLSSLKLIASTGEPWNPEPWQWLFEHVGDKQVPIFNYSGGTEISGGILGNILLKPIAPVNFNAPLPGMAVNVFDEKGQPVRNEVGELVLQQPWVGMAHGFWQEPERYVDTYWSRWTDTWVHGDWVIVDDDGFWTITGRSDDTLNIAGKRLGPAEMESVLVNHDAVLEAATIGVPDDVKGEVAVCFVVLQPDVKESDALQKELMDRVAEHLGKALKPQSIYFVSDIPKTRNAKVMRRAVRAAYLGKEAGDLSSLENPEAIEEIRQQSPITK